MNAKHLAFIGRICSYAAQFLIIAALPLALTPELFTKYNLIMPILMLGSSVIYGWLNGAAFRWAHKVSSREDSQFRIAITYYYATSLLLSLSITAGLMLANRHEESLIPLAIFALSIKDYYLKVSNANEEYAQFAVANIIYMIGKLIFLTLLYFFKIQDFQAILLMFIASEIIFATPFAAAPHFKPSASSQIIKNLREMFRYGAPLIAASIAVWIVSLSDRYILNMFTDKMTVANYILVYQFAANAITVPLMFFITIYFPTLIKMERESGLASAMQHNKAMFRRYCLYAPIYAIFVGGTLYIALKFFYQKYHADGALIAVVMAAQLLCGASHFYNKQYELDNRTHLIAIAVFISAIADVICNLMLIPRFGALGAAISGFIAYGTLIAVTANLDSLLNGRKAYLTRKIL